MTRTLLWTGGWDSTFRLLQLALVERCEVRPLYVIDLPRPSFPVELRAMRAIRDALPTEGRDRIAPLTIVERSDIPANAAITRKYEALRSRAHLGNQYEWLARLAEWQKLDALELSIHQDDKAHHFLADVVERGEAIAGSSKRAASLAASVAPDDDLSLFRAFSFPLFDFSKLEMAAYAREHRFDAEMEMTVFCYFPDKKGRPCGRCNPCRYTAEEGLARRIPARRRIADTVWRRTGAHRIENAIRWRLARFRA